MITQWVDGEKAHGKRQQSQEAMRAVAAPNSQDVNQLLTTLPRLAQIGALVASTGALLVPFGDQLWSPGRGRGYGV